MKIVLNIIFLASLSAVKKTLTNRNPETCSLYFCVYSCFAAGAVMADVGKFCKS